MNPAPSPNPGHDSGSVPVADPGVLHGRISTRLYSHTKGIEVHVRNFEIGDCGPDIRDFAMITLSDLEKRLDAVTHDRCHYYTNPAWTVIAPGTVNELAFIKEAERACVHWMTRIRHTFRPGPVNRMLRAVDPSARALSSSGILFIAGRQTHVSRLNWRRAKKL